MAQNVSLDRIYQYLLISLAFFMPLTVFIANVIIVIIVLLWLFSGSYKIKLQQIFNNKFIIASIGFYLLHIIGLIWTEELEWGFKILHKMWYFILLLPILFTIVKKKYIQHYISAFLIAISFTELISYLVWFEILEPFKIVRLPDTLTLIVLKNADTATMVANPTPFMSHISYNPILAFAIYLVYHEIFLNKNLNQFKFFLYSFFAFTMTFNMFITGGRAGQVMYFAMLAIMIFQFFNSEKIKSLIAMILIIPIIFFTAYKTSDLFEARVNSAVQEVVKYETNFNSSVGKRIAYAINSWDIIKKNPILGVGTGDFPTEFKKVGEKNKNLSGSNPTNPHNMYNLVTIQLGLLGLISFLSIFYYQFKFALSASSKFTRNVGFTLPALFLVIMFSDSYLLGHFTTLLYVYFSSFLYKDFEQTE
jgi:O-antigen ligase